MCLVIIMFTEEKNYIKEKRGVLVRIWSKFLQLCLVTLPIVLWTAMFLINITIVCYRRCYNLKGNIYHVMSARRKYPFNVVKFNAYATVLTFPFKISLLNRATILTILLAIYEFVNFSPPDQWHLRIIKNNNFRNKFELTMWIWDPQ